MVYIQFPCRKVLRDHRFQPQLELSTSAGGKKFLYLEILSPGARGVGMWAVKYIYLALFFLTKNSLTLSTAEIYFLVGVYLLLRAVLTWVKRKDYDTWESQKCADLRKHCI